MKKKRFIIVSGRVTRGGTLVLANMCRLLREKGYDARMFYMPSVPEKGTDMRKWWLTWVRSTLKMPFVRLLCALNKNSQKPIYQVRREILYTPIKGLPVVRVPVFDKKNTIVVYPEIVYGNFLHAKNVVRYLLYYNKFKDDPNAFGADDLFISYSSIFHDHSLSKEIHLVQLSYFDSTTYRQFNFGPREGNCYIGRKGRERADYPKEFDGPVIDNGMPEKEIVRIFNNSKFCYSYDPQTFYNIIAAVCGCIPIIVMEPGKTEKDYYGETDKPMGVAYGDTPEQLDHAVKTRDILIKSLDYKESNEKNIEYFLGLLGCFDRK